MMKKILIITVALLVSISSFAQENLEEQLKYLQTQIEKIEKRCTPQAGMAKEEVERIFGIGKPASNNKIPPKVIPPDSPYRSYQLCENGILFVCYAANKVQWAHYINPYSTKSIPLGHEIAIETKINEAKQRLKQLQLIEKEYLKKTKEKL